VQEEERINKRVRLSNQKLDNWESGGFTQDIEEEDKRLVLREKNDDLIRANWSGFTPGRRRRRERGSHTGERRGGSLGCRGNSRNTGSRKRGGPGGSTWLKEGGVTPGGKIINKFQEFTRKKMGMATGKTYFLYELKTSLQRGSNEFGGSDKGKDRGAKWRVPILFKVKTTERRTWTRRQIPDLG